MSFLTAVKTLYPEQTFKHHVSSRAEVDESVSLGVNVHIGAFSTVGKNSSISDNSEIFAGVHIGMGVTIGKNCKIYPQVVIYDNTQIGDNVIIHSGSVIGADGFGYKFRNNQHVKVPHVGNVVIADHVEIGANTCIDRGALGSTVIGAGSKIDNLVQLGHNNKVGRNVIICGQSGISGSCTIEDGAILAGSSGIADHVTIGQRAVVMARSGVSQDIAAGTQVFGSPARDRKVAWKELAALTKLPELLKKFKALESRVQDLEK
jgi:UDP-3-O-[3-hydroxymyristoyl] glucosamine N-acyltransferase